MVGCKGASLGRSPGLVVVTGQGRRGNDLRRMATGREEPCLRLVMLRVVDRSWLAASSLVLRATAVIKGLACEYLPLWVNEVAICGSSA